MSAAPSFDIANPEWLAHRYDRASDRILFHHVPRAIHRDGPFLTDELIGQQPRQIVDRASVAQASRLLSGPVHFVFHSAFCASTLLVRALDHPGLAMGLSEPVLLNDSVGIRRRGEMSGAEIARLADDSLHLLARRWPGDAAVVIKPSNIVNALAPALLSLAPGARAIVLHAPLRQFLSSVARKGLWCRLWVRELLEGQLREGSVQLGFEAPDYFRLTDLQVAAVGWLAQHMMFHRLAAQFGPERVRTLNADALMTDPGAVVRALGRLYALPMSANVAETIGQGPVFNRHSKSGAAFDAQARLAERAAAEAAHGDEIDKVFQWAETLAASHGVAMDLPSPLIR